MKLALSAYPGSFRLPNEAELWLLREREAYHLYTSIPLEESNFSLRAVSSLIEDENVDHSGKYDEDWGFFNSSIIGLGEMEIYALRPTVRSGEILRDDKDLLAAIEKFDPKDMKIVEVGQNDFKIETGRDGEYVSNDVKNK
jgi:hypothetical protein